MTKPINLNQARKAKAKAAAEAQAAENRVRFGRTKTDKAIEKAQANRAMRLLDQSKREP